MLLKPFFNYRVFIWMLLGLAVLMGAVFLIIAHTYNLQKTTEYHIESARVSVTEAKEMENELKAIKGLTYTYIVNKSSVWLDSLEHHDSNFIIHLERARLRANTQEEKLLIQQVSALFSNYEQNILIAIERDKNNDRTTANALLLHSAQDLLGTIQRKSNEFIKINQQTEEELEREQSITNSVISKILISLGIGGIVVGLLFGWLISRLLFGPINQLVLTVRGASGETVLEKLRLSSGNELSEIGDRVKELIAKINKANEDLSKNKELLQYSNKYAALGKIAPTIAHEIRNPLAAIKMLVYSIGEDSSVSESVKDDLNIISSEIVRMENFTKDFLRFAKPADPVFTQVNPTIALSEVIHLLKPRFKKSNIILIENTPKLTYSVLADSGQLKQIFLNIILNAIDAMPNGGTLTINAEITTALNPVLNDTAKEFMRIDIQDSGNGIPLAILNNLFEPFIKGSDQGVGIGLSISQSIANSHGGWIAAENSSLLSGAVFKVFLPTIMD